MHITILGDFIILSLIGVLRIPEEFYLYKDKDKDGSYLIQRTKLFEHYLHT